MANKIVLICLALFCLQVSAFHSEWINILQGYDHKYNAILSLINLSGFCFFPGNLIHPYNFLMGVHRQQGVDTVEHQLVTSPEYHLTLKYSFSGLEKVPLKTHRIWITSEDYPREMMKVLKDPFL